MEETSGTAENLEKLGKNSGNFFDKTSVYTLCCEKKG